MFATAGETLARSLFLGGVPHRFPTLRFAFQEGGVAWAAALYVDPRRALGEAQPRRGRALQPGAPRPRSCSSSCSSEYGSRRYRERLDQLDDGLRMLSLPDEDPTTLDEFARRGIESADDIRDVFTGSFHFGCEADDPMTALAFDTGRNPLGARLQAIFASDIGHWDVPDIREVLPEAWELVEDGHVTEADFRALTFENAVSLWAGRTRVLRGHEVEGAVATELSGSGLSG